MTINLKLCNYIQSVVTIFRINIYCLHSIHIFHIQNSNLCTQHLQHRDPVDGLLKKLNSNIIPIIQFVSVLKLCAFFSIHSQ